MQKINILNENVQLIELRTFNLSLRLVYISNNNNNNTNIYKAHIINIRKAEFKAPAVAMARGG